MNLKMVVILLSILSTAKAMETATSSSKPQAIYNLVQQYGPDALGICKNSALSKQEQSSALHMLAESLVQPLTQISTNSDELFEGLKQTGAIANGKLRFHVLFSLEKGLPIQEFLNLMCRFSNIEVDKVRTNSMHSKISEMLTDRTYEFDSPDLVVQTLAEYNKIDVIEQQLLERDKMILSPEGKYVESLQIRLYYLYASSLALYHNEVRRVFSNNLEPISSQQDYLEAKNYYEMLCSCDDKMSCFLQSLIALKIPPVTNSSDEKLIKSAYAAFINFFSFQNQPIDYQEYFKGIDEEKRELFSLAKNSVKKLLDEASITYDH